MTIVQNYQKLLLQLPHDRHIQVVCVTKYATPSQIIEAYQAGLRDFGENKVQDVESKFQLLPKDILQDTRWHMIGHLQQNKAKKALTIGPSLILGEGAAVGELASHTDAGWGRGFALIHSIHSLELAQKVSSISESLNRKQPVLLQVNITREPQKTGFLEETLWQEFSQLMGLHGIDIQGLMTIGPNTDDATESVACFKRLHDLRGRLEDQFGHALRELSMGMSKDFIHAIKSGATIIRIGSHFFGDKR